MPPRRPFERLPLDPSPVHYDLSYTRVSLDDTFDFRGTVKILLEYKNEQKSGDEALTMIRLNALDLAISSAKLSDGRGAMQRLVVVPGEQIIELYFAAPTTTQPAGTRVTLEIEFQGQLNDLLAGFYRSKLQGGGEKKHDEYMACTQFEPTDARRAFPCWDEPARKATFKLTLRLPSAYFCLSNTRVESKTTATNGGDQIVEYYATPKMSTYLLAWVVAPRVDCFDCLSRTSQTAPHVETLVYVARGKLKQAEFAARVGVGAIDFFSHLFALPYPLPQLKHIAIPDFAAGAMENWGLVTYREARLLVDEAKISSSAKRDVARVVAHETAHMWFGNSTTMEWWTDLWLNEGFARFCEYLCVDHLLPELDVFTSFVVDVVGVALKLDALRSTHAVRVEVSHPSEISEIFDTVSYAKGGSLLRMCVHLMGGLDSWAVGVQRYLKLHQYGNAVSSQLWEALEPEMPRITEIMTQWTDQVGYPLVYVSSTGQLTQKRYLTIQGAEGEEDKSSRWTLPLRVISPGCDRVIVCSPTTTEETGETAREEGDGSAEVTAAIGQQQQAWFVLNGNADLFRVRYTDDQFRAICQTGFFAGGQELLPVRARLAVVRDLFDLAESAHSGLALALELGLHVLARERDTTVLLVLVTKLQAVVSLCSGSSSGDGDEVVVGQHLRRLVSRALQPVLTALGPWELLAAEEEAYFSAAANDDKLDELRVAVLRLASDCGDEDDGIGAVALDKCLRHCAGESAACSNNLRPCVFRLALGSGSSSEQAFDALEARFPQVDSQEQREILSALAGIRHRSLLQRALLFVCGGGASSSLVRTQDVPAAVAAMCAAAGGAELLWEDFQTNFAAKWSKYADGGFFLWSTVVSSIAGNLPTHARALEVKLFFEREEHRGRLGSAARALDQALEKVAARDAQLARYQAELVDLVTA